MKGFSTSHRERTVRYLSQVQEFEPCLSKRQFERGSSVLPLWDRGPKLEIVHRSDALATINGSSATRISKGSGNFGIYRRIHRGGETIIKLIAGSPVYVLSSLSHEVAYLDEKKVHDLEDYELEGMGLRQDLTRASRVLWSICRGALHGGPAPLDIGICSVTLAGRDPSYYFYIELEALDTGDNDAITLKDLLREKGRSEQEQWIDRRGVQPFFLAGRMIADAVCDGIDPIDVDFMITSNGMIRWIDTDAWRRLDRGECFTFELIIILASLQAVDQRAARAFLIGLFRGWIAASASPWTRIQALTILSINQYAREFGCMVMRSYKG